MLSDFLRILFTVLLVMDPIGIIPLFLSVTSQYDEKTKKSIILKAVFFAGLVLLVFVLTGKFLLEFFGIMPGSFNISGGILFFLIAFGMIYSKPKLSASIPKKKPGPEDPETDDHTGVSIALFPLAIPFIAGPGLLTVIIMFVTRGDSWLYSAGILLSAIIIGLIVMFIILRSSSLVLKFFGSMGIFIMEKIMGLILAGFSVQLVYDGMVTLGIIHP